MSADPCHPTCRKCSSTLVVGNTYNSCDYCGPQRYAAVDTFSCSNCIDNCEVCDDGTSCKQCSVGYTYDETNAVCVQNTCINTCSFCDRNSTGTITSTNSYFNCMICPTRKYLSYNAYECDPCPDDCEQCSNGNSCDVCRTGFSWDAVANKCTQVLCNKSCDTCDQNNLIIPKFGDRYYGCSKCPATTFLNTKTYTCDTCISNCQQCPDNLTCSACSDGYSLISGNCVKNSCSPTCDSCADDVVITAAGAQPYQFCSCQAGKYLKDNGYECGTCSTGCDECLNASKCKTCSEGYTMVSGICTLLTCDSSCLTCDRSSEPTTDSSKTSFNCLRCPAKTYVSDDRYSCVACQANCDSCDDGVSCNKCSKGYTIANDACLKIACDPTCSVCDPNSLATTIGAPNPHYLCSTCPVGKFLKTNAYECASCPANCDSCKDATSCNTCSVGFSQDPITGKCVQNICSPTCGTCDQSSSPTPIGDQAYYDCAICPPRSYRVNDYKCHSCMSYCDSCQDNASCDICIPGYNLVNTECIPATTAITESSSHESQVKTNKLIGGIIGGVVGLTVLFSFICIVRYFVRKSEEKRSPTLTTRKYPPNSQRSATKI